MSIWDIMTKIDMDTNETLRKIDRSLTAILMLLVEKRESKTGKLDESSVKNIEVMLSEIGFSGPDVAKLVNKNLSAVQKAIQRGRKKIIWNTVKE